MQFTPRSRRVSLRRILSLWSALLAALAGIVIVNPGMAEGAAGATTAWQNGNFRLDAVGVVSRSDIVLGSPNVDPTASMPLGNGSLGVAAWAAGGFTAQLNRSDTMPDRKSPGQVNIPGLSVISHAADFSGQLDLTDGVLRESGGGMSMKAWVAAEKDELIVEVSGANPDIAQTATVNLWSGRKPAAAVSGDIGTLAETWVDGAPSIGSGKTFGSLAAITAGGEQVTTTVAGPTQVKVSFKPHADGTFRVVVASPAWTGGDAAKTASKLIDKDATVPESTLMSAQDRWWDRYWRHTGLVAMDSADGSAAYMENLRTLYLYEEAASMREGIYPGSQAGQADMFSWNKDAQTWNPSAYWLWNLRTQISANMSSGNYDLNTPIFDMYSDDLADIEAWTKMAMGGLPGSCVSETMRFNGNGIEVNGNGSCSQASAPNWNALNITSGPEVAMYMWQQYQATGDLKTLKKYWPFIKSTAVFLLAYQKVGADGLLHANANAHETQWSVNDPATDIAADLTLFPIIQQAAKELGTDKKADAALVQQATKALTQIPPYPRTDQATLKQLLNPHYTAAETAAADATGTDVLAISYEPAAARRNGENIELEPLWPWNTVSDQDPNLFALEQRSYAHRPNKGGNDWSMDAIHAARLQNPAEVRSNLISITEGHQVYPNGFADLGNTVGYQPYIEQASGVATAVNEALAQDYDGIIRFAPAWPADWNVSGTVYIRDNGKVDVQVQDGRLVTAVIETGASAPDTLRVKNPWPGQQVEVVDGKNGHKVVAPSSQDILTVPVKKDKSYLVQQVSAPTTGLPFAEVTGSAPTAARHLGKVQLGLDKTAQSGTATVGTVLGGANQGYGLTQVDYSGSAGATTTAGDVSSLTARTTGTGTGADGSDMYFDVDDNVAATGSYDGKVAVSYFDTGTGAISVQYDAGPKKAYQVAGSIALTDSHTWKTAEVPVSDAYFGGSQNAGADLRLHADHSITVHSVGVTVTGPWVPNRRAFPPAPVIVTPRGGATVKLASSISGTTIPNGVVTVRKGSAVVCTTTANGAGAWSCAPDGGLARGQQTINATVADPSGLTGDASAAVSFNASDLPSGTAVVGAVVGPTNYAYGMSEDEKPSGGFDGPTTASVIDGLTARTSTQSNIYFDIDDSIAHAGFYSATFTISYYDQGSGSFAVHYDNGGSDPYKSTAGIQLTGTNTWKTATVSVSDAYFGGQQHSDADFRIRNGGGQVTVHSVVVKVIGDGVPDVTRFAPPVTITSPVAGTTVTAEPTVSGSSEPDAKVTVTAEGTPVCTATASDDGTWTCSSSTALVAGEHTLTATATDVTATPAAAATVAVTVQ
ncbi:Ig-like domain-containing protein [Streptosporangium subroseum]|uniref:Ig-like domain-containing protein n=1 Tax=Streptosporangium subroseum TaxID=106412 RepID=UPI00308895FF|nr:Ig-like domain-containing protein [Streptosporangium subroseum]